MTLIAKPKLIAIDNSILGKVSKDFYSENLENQTKALDFFDNIKLQGLVPLFCFHHIAEILQHENENIVSAKLSLIANFPQVAWVKSISQNLSIGSIIDIQGAEIQKAISSPSISLSELVETVRNELISYSTGSDFIEMIGPECYVIREMNLIDIQRGKAVDSISHVRDPNIDKVKLSVLKKSRLKTNDEVLGSFGVLKNKYLSELHERGDRKLEGHDGIVSNFLHNVWEFGEKLHKQRSNSLYINFLNTLGIDEKYVNENWTVGELGYFAIFKEKLKVISRSFSLNEEDVLKYPLSTFPSWHIWVELDKRIRKEKYAHGSNIIDKYLGAFSLYADILVVDKRIKEYFKQIIRREDKFSVLRGKIIKSSDYSKMPGNL